MASYLRSGADDRIIQATTNIANAHLIADRAGLAPGCDRLATG